MAIAIVSVTVAGILLRREAVRAAATASLQAQVSDDLHEVARLRSAFLRSISHELRTPLTNVIGYGETVQAHLGRLEPERIIQLTDRMVVNARRLERLVLDLLDLDQIALSDPDTHPVPVVVRELLLDVVRDLPDQRLDVEVSSTAGVVLIDLARTRRIAYELLQNVVRHTPAGTRVVITASATDNRLRLVVEDDGPGVDRSLIDDVFEPFVQGTEVRTSASPGLGIGLPLVRRYTELVGGTVRLEEPDHGGTRVVVMLPAFPARVAKNAGVGEAVRPSLIGSGVIPPMSASLGQTRTPHGALPPAVRRPTPSPRRTGRGTASSFGGSL